jgi:hypothetical protein
MRLSLSWLRKLAADIEERHGKEARDKVFGDLENMSTSRKFITEWFDNFIDRMDELNDREFLQAMMAKRCPCGPGTYNYKKQAKYIRESYDESESMEDFVEKLRNAEPPLGDNLELQGNILYNIKNPYNRKESGSCGNGCHCQLACHTNKQISDIFCYCCTVAHDGKPFVMAFGEDVKVEFAYSLINGGKACASATHLPNKW